MFGRRPVRWQLRALVVAICLFMVLGAAITVALMRTESRTVDHLTSVVGPAYERNSMLYRATSTAESALTTYRTTGDPARAEQFSAARTRIHTLRGEVGRLLRLVAGGEDRQRGFERLRSRRDAALAVWLGYADRSLVDLVAGRPVDAGAGDALFDRFRTADDELAAMLRSELARFRASSEEAAERVTLSAIATTVSALICSLAMAHLVTRSITRPIAALLAVVQGRMAGDTTVFAREDRGPREVRELAAAGNALTADINALLAEQAESLRLHEVALRLIHTVRDLSTLQEALHTACAELGQALRVDRLVVSLVDETGQITRTAHWHAPGLPDFPPDVSPYAGPIAERLWRAGTDLVIADTRQEEADHSWFAPYRREADARALCVVPIGLVDPVLGVLSAHVLDHPRHWAPAEMALMHNAAAFLAHAVTQAQHRTNQTEYVARLERLDHEKNKFLSTVSHELRTPLTSITGYLELLMDGAAGEVSPAQRRMFEVIHRNAVRLRRLIEDLLVMNRVEADILRLTAQPVPLVELLEQTVEELQPQADKSRVRVLPRTEGGHAAHVLGDRGYLQRALLNVVVNAIKFTPAGGSVEITLEVNPDTDTVTVRCADTGIGIPRAELDHLGKRFFRASNATSRAIPGTGLGLAIVKAIVDAHGGHLSIESVKDEGTTVTLRFPLADHRPSPPPDQPGAEVAADTDHG